MVELEGYPFMSQFFFDCLDFFDSTFWNYFGVPGILILGLYLSSKARFMQIFHFPRVWHIFYSLISKKQELKKTETTRGINPVKAFFAAVGGCIGVGNIVVVCTAVQLGGPGAVFWMWIAALFGMIVKYSEIYLGIKYRVKNNNGGYDGGPMYFLQHATKQTWVAQLVCILLCIYGVDVYLFRTITHSFTTWWGWNQYLVITGFIIAILLGGQKGVEQVGKISSTIIPLFLMGFVTCSVWIFIENWSAIPSVFMDIIQSAFTPRAAIGAFTGTTMITTIAHGMKRACYSGDIGIGYASIIHSETKETDPARQASLGILEIFLDTFVVCTASAFLILVTNLWHQAIPEDQLLAHILGEYIPMIHILWPIFIFILGYSTILAIFASGTKAAKFLLPKDGPFFYKIYATIIFVAFSFIGTDNQIMTIMSATGGLLLAINLWTIFRLRKEIQFKIPTKNN